MQFPFCFAQLFSLFFSLSAFTQLKVENNATDFTQEPHISWTFNTGSPVYSSPVIDSNTVFFGSCDSCLYSLDVKKGSVQWKLKTGGEIKSTPCIVDQNIYFLSGDGFCYCLNKITGNVTWKFATKGERQYSLFSFADYTQSSPVYKDAVIYFGSGDGNVYAVKALNGSLIWKYKTGDVVHATPVMDSVALYVGSFDGWFYSLDLSTGKLNWKFKSVGQKYFPKGEMQGTAFAVNDIVVAGSRDYNLYGINRRGGFCEWNRKFVKGWAMGVPAFNDSLLFVGTSDDHEMHAIDPVTGFTQWKMDAKFNIFGSPAFTSSLLYFGTLSGKLFALEQKTGRIIWNFSTEGYRKNHNIYFDSADVLKKDVFGTVIKKNEDFLEMYLRLGGIFSKPAISSSHLIITTLDGNVYGLVR